MDATELVIDQDDSLLEDLTAATASAETATEAAAFDPESLPDLWEEPTATPSLGFESEAATNDADFSDLFAANDLTSLSDESDLGNLDLDAAFESDLQESGDSSFEDLLASSELSDMGAIATPDLSDASTGELDALDFGDLMEPGISTDLGSSNDLDTLDFGDLMEPGEGPSADLTELGDFSIEGTSELSSDSVPDPWSDAAESNSNLFSESPETGLFDDLDSDTGFELADLNLEAETADPFGMEVAGLGETTASAFEPPVSDALSEASMFDLETDADLLEETGDFGLEAAPDANPAELSLDPLGLDSLTEGSDQSLEAANPDFDTALFGETVEDELGFFSMEGDLDDSSLMAIDSDAESTFPMPDTTTELLGFDDADSSEASDLGAASASDDAFGDLLLDSDTDLSGLDLSAELDLSIPATDSAESLNFDDLESESLFAESASAEADLLSFDDGAIASDSPSDLGDDLLSMDLGATESDDLSLDFDQLGEAPAETTELLFEEMAVTAAAEAPFSLPDTSSEFDSTADMGLGLDFDGLEFASDEDDLGLGVGDLATEPTLGEGDLGLDFDGLALETTAESSSDTTDLGFDFDSLETESVTAADSDVDLGLDFDGLGAESGADEMDLGLGFDSLEPESGTDATELGLDFGDLTTEPTAESNADDMDLGLDFDSLEPESGTDATELGLDFGDLTTEPTAESNADDMDLGLDFDGLGTASGADEMDLGLGFDSLEPESGTDATELGLDFGDLTTEPTAESNADDMDLGLDFDGLGAESGSEMSMGLDLDDLATEPGADDAGFDLSFGDLEAEPGSEMDLGLDFGDLSTESASSPNSEMDLGLDLDDLGGELSGGEMDLGLDFSGLDAESLETGEVDAFGTADTSESFGGLDDLLAETPGGDEFGSDEFASLDNLLADEAGSDEFAGLDDLLNEEDNGGMNGFADLDSLLADDAAIAAAVQPLESTSTDVEFSDLEALLDGTDTQETVEESDSLDSEFDELDDLLKDAEEKMGGSPSMTRSSVTRPSRPARSSAEQTMRVPVKHLDNLSNLVGELVVNRNSLEQDQERLRQSLDNLLYQVQQLGDVGQRMQDLYERSLLESSLLASRQKHRVGSGIMMGHPAEVENTAGGQEVEYDPLEMDRFTGFHSLSQEMIELIVRVRESASDIEFIVDETDQVTRMFRQVTTQLQEGLTRSRMMPFAQTADRLPRAVRDISIKVGKQAELIIEGRETLIDKMILEKLYDPLTHLVNNAITHGIEPPTNRQNSGKPSAGRITVRAFHQGNQTVISVSDDGAGIDVDRVKRKAVEKGLISPSDVQNLTRLDVYDLLFHPGFSTADQVDEFRGRGVGMDVVRTSLSEIRGVINTDSTPGKGTTFTIRLPLTLSISKALCCISDRARIAFPMDGVEDMLDLPKERIQTNAEGQHCISWRDTILPLRPLSDLLAYNRHLSRGNVYGGNQEDDIVSIVVLRSAGNYLALQVDQVLGEQEIVIKQLEGPVPKPIGVAGATVLGDGRIMPIADVLELIDLSMGRIRRDAGGSLWDKGAITTIQEPAIVKTEPMVLIVDDSITVRELLSMTFNKVGYRVEQARDGQEAWEKLRSGLPCDIVFCDIEMPRMDGLELLSRIQKDSTLSHLPIAMLTSRGADRHRQMASSLGASGYFTKPYLEEALLDAAQRMLKGEKLL
ncbi:MAG TPA: hybrid sensor histidine kinase/response regulator [Leptolyngbyaceae cyanobacterium M33_DOE_097]|nr:hybrid sensor histidine kinase/response regulator [Leptolyngbyaceae cyanobacterium M33_DOE_097]